MTRAAMIDLETWGVYPDSQIRSIGATHFDYYLDRPGASDRPDFDLLLRHRSFYRNTTYGDRKIHYDGVFGTRSSATAIFRQYADTVEWWQLPENARALAWLTNPAPIDISDAITKLKVWLDDYQVEEVWSDSPALDFAALKHHCAHLGLPIPWHYRGERDMRTVANQVKQHVCDNAYACKDNLTGYIEHVAHHDSAAQTVALLLMLDSQR